MPNVLVTGGSQRLGRAISLSFSAAGYGVLIHCNRSRNDADALAGEITQKGGRAWVLQSSLDDPLACRELVRRAVLEAGTFSILVNNASMFSEGDIMKPDLAEIYRTLNVNTLSPYMLSLAFSEFCGRGCILNVLDTRNEGYSFDRFPYFLSKQLLQTITLNLALRFAPEIRVNGIAPGLILPPKGKDASYLERLKETVPLKSHGDAVDVAEAALFLARSRFITGEVIHVDGGQHLLHRIFGNSGKIQEVK